MAFDRCNLTAQEIPIAISWEQMRISYFERHGQLYAADQCRALLHRLEQLLWADALPEASDG